MAAREGNDQGGECSYGMERVKRITANNLKLAKLKLPPIPFQTQVGIAPEQQKKGRKVIFYKT